MIFIMINLVLFENLNNFNLHLDLYLRLRAYAGLVTMVQTQLILLCCNCKNHVTMPFLFVGSTPSNVYQDFDTCLVVQGTHMIVPIFEQMGVSRTVSFLLWCYCGDTLLGVWKPIGLDFQLLDERSQLWWLSFPFFIMEGLSHFRKIYLLRNFFLITSSYFLVSKCTKQLNYANSILFLVHSKIFV